MRSIDSDFTLSQPVESESPQLSGSLTMDLAVSACSELIAPLAFFAPRTAREPYENKRNNALSMVGRWGVGLCPYRCLQSLGDWNAVAVLEATSSNHDDVDKPPNSTSTECDQFEDSSSDFTRIEVIYSKTTEDDAQNQ